MGGFLVLSVIALVVGALSRAIVPGTRGGCLVSIVVSLIGAFLGGYLVRAAGMPTLFVVQGVDLIWGIIGAVLFLAVPRLLSRA